MHYLFSHNTAPFTLRERGLVFLESKPQNESQSLPEIKAEQAERAQKETPEQAKERIQKGFRDFQRRLNVAYDTLAKSTSEPVEKVDAQRIDSFQKLKNEVGKVLSDNKITTDEFHQLESWVEQEVTKIVGKVEAGSVVSPNETLLRESDYIKREIQDTEAMKKDAIKMAKDGSTTTFDDFRSALDKAPSIFDKIKIALNYFIGDKSLSRKNLLPAKESQEKSLSTIEYAYNLITKACKGKLPGNMRDIFVKVGSDIQPPIGLEKFIGPEVRDSIAKDPYLLAAYANRINDFYRVMDKISFLINKGQLGYDEKNNVIVRPKERVLEDSIALMLKGSFEEGSYTFFSPEWQEREVDGRKLAFINAGGNYVWDQEEGISYRVEMISGETHVDKVDVNYALADLVRFAPGEKTFKKQSEIKIPEFLKSYFSDTPDAVYTTDTFEISRLRKDKDQTIVESLDKDGKWKPASAKSVEAITKSFDRFSKDRQDKEKEKEARTAAWNSLWQKITTNTQKGWQALSAHAEDLQKAIKAHLPIRGETPQVRIVETPPGTQKALVTQMVLGTPEFFTVEKVDDELTFKSVKPEEYPEEKKEAVQALFKGKENELSTAQSIAQLLQKETANTSIFDGGNNFPEKPKEIQLGDKNLQIVSSGWGDNLMWNGEQFFKCTVDANKKVEVLPYDRSMAISIILNETIGSHVNFKSSDVSNSPFVKTFGDIFKDSEATYVTQGYTLFRFIEKDGKTITEKLNFPTWENVDPEKNDAADRTLEIYQYNKERSERIATYVEIAKQLENSPNQWKPMNIASNKDARYLQAFQFVPGIKPQLLMAKYDTTSKEDISIYECNTSDKKKDPETYRFFAKTSPIYTEAKKIFL